MVWFKAGEAFGRQKFPVPDLPPDGQLRNLLGLQPAAAAARLDGLPGLKPPFFSTALEARG
eukprot:6082532-Lingulodinium_polyedra.AAC.1